MDVNLYIKLKDIFSDVWLEEFKSERLFSDEFEMNKFYVQEINKKLSESNMKIIDESQPKEPEDVPVLIGTLNSSWGNVGYHVCEPGTPVYETKDRYQIETIPLNDKLPVKIVRFYKDSPLPIKQLDNEENK